MAESESTAMSIPRENTMPTSVTYILDFLHVMSSFLGLAYMTRIQNVDLDKHNNETKQYITTNS